MSDYVLNTTGIWDILRKQQEDQIKNSLRTKLAQLDKQHAEAVVEVQKARTRFDEASKDAQAKREHLERWERRYQETLAHRDKQNATVNELRQKASALDHMIGQYNGAIAGLADIAALDPSVVSSMRVVRDGLQAGVRMHRHDLVIEESCARGAQYNLNAEAAHLECVRAEAARANDLVVQARAARNAATQRRNGLFVDREAVKETLALLERK
ncbi:MAG TPA: hypothetical protein VFS21_03100 [Roseiflexaceae bacterium]|nr:hypothetical protein [Roseiflexaceae bacterium]